MVDRIPHDHPSVESVRATLERAGRMNHPKLVLPGNGEPIPDTDSEMFPESVVHIVLSGQQYHARIEQNFDGIPEIRAVRDNARLAREGDGENRLHEWFDAIDLGFGRSVHVDVIEPDHLYGVRLPGERAVYTDVPEPKDSLADIARDLEGREQGNSDRSE